MNASASYGDFVADAAKAAAVVSTECRAGKVARDPAATDMVVYHGSECPDGFGAAFAAWKLLGDRATYVAADHGPAAPRLDVRGRHVVVVDYCFSPEETQRFIREAASFIVLDHHASAQAALAGVDDAYKVFEMRQSGATLSWNYFHGADVPLMFRYIEDKDIWRWAFRDSDAFSAGFNLPLEFAAWNALLEEGAAGVQRTIAAGRSVLAYRRSVVDSHVKRAVPCRLKAAPQFRGMIVNASTLSSEIGNALATKPEIDYGLMWTFEHDTRVFRCSLRSASDECDVSRIAAHFGGGGHKRASGFSYPGAHILDLLE